MESLVGLALALAVLVSATLIGLDRGRAFYPTRMIVIAFYSGLFAVMGGSVQVLLLECIAIAVFSGLRPGWGNRWPCVHSAREVMAPSPALNRTRRCAAPRSRDFVAAGR